MNKYIDHRQTDFYISFVLISLQHQSRASFNIVNESFCHVIAKICLYQNVAHANCREKMIHGRIDWELFACEI
jgi:hypothetical protein